MTQVVEEENDKEDPKEQTATPLQPEVNVEDKVNSLMATMTLREKIGQLMIVGFNSKMMDQHIKR